ncbi:hypothetical protein GPECTOR_3g472 [Gonium pectorale]|uniref:Uncharacterized protein n=1 Tax=Gonium pectorale TaxID=33097 RepID=A0A150GZR8_GONPE|nr:hypothetical protein GPECTOR_3g472 [Gonium pectorale]|eukprot:KXZ55341.1 hypothetical protein GPECTOR_3g472 [Gonium pectorale]
MLTASNSCCCCLRAAPARRSASSRRCVLTPRRAAASLLPPPLRKSAVPTAAAASARPVGGTGALAPLRRRPLRPPPARFRNRDDDAAESAVGSILSASSIDVMLHSAHLLIDSAERRIGDYCSTFAPADHDHDAGADAAAGGGGAGARRCWHVYRSLRRAAKRLEAAAGAEAVTTGRAGPACADVASLERLIRWTFCDIVEAQRLVVPGSDAVFLRHLRHARPEWWSDMPASMDQG